MAVNRNSVIKEAQKFAGKGQFDKAITEWRKLVKDTPNDANIFNTIGDLCLKKNAKAEAVDAYKRAADILAEDGFASKAIALYKKVLNIDMSRIDVHLALGDSGVSPGPEVWFVGDTDVDMLCARASGCTGILLNLEAPSAEMAAARPAHHVADCAGFARLLTTVCLSA